MSAMSWCGSSRAVASVTVVLSRGDTDAAARGRAAAPTQPVMTGQSATAVPYSRSPGPCVRPGVALVAQSVLNQ